MNVESHHLISLALVFERCSESLKKHIFDNIESIPWKTKDAVVSTFQWSKQILNALEFIHGKDMVHRDLKLDNVLVRVVWHKWKSHAGLLRGYRLYYLEYKAYSISPGWYKKLFSFLHIRRSCLHSVLVVIVTYFVTPHRQSLPFPWAGFSQRNLCLVRSLQSYNSFFVWFALFRFSLQARNCPMSYKVVENGYYFDSFALTSNHVIISVTNEQINQTRSLMEDILAEILHQAV